MAASNLKSNAVTTADATPATTNEYQSLSPKIASGRLRESVGTIETNKEDVGSTYRLARVHSSVRVSDILLSNDALTAGVIDIGVYETADNGGAVVDKDCLASGASIATAQKNKSVFEVDPANIEKPLWEVAGKTSDPGRLYDIVATSSTAPTAAGTLSLTARFVDGN